jgi:SAM-dependent methyltransferase
MKYLNLGCGSRFHSDFVNIDIASSSHEVLTHDIAKGIPYPAGTFDLVYHSHLLEHLKKDSAIEFLKECYRVLTKRGIIRVAVPDLEQIARTYLEALDKVLQGQKQWVPNYDWMMLELYDQVVRKRRGGAMLEFLKQNPLPNETFVFQRVGGEARAMIEALREQASNNNGQTTEARNYFADLRTRAQFLREKLVQILLSKADYEALETGRFRASGVIHQWMYDRYSLARVLEQVGFQKPVAMGANESQIPGWTEYHLDTEPDGTVYKPDSLFMEAVKSG